MTEGWTLTEAEIAKAVEKMSADDRLFLKRLQRWGTPNEVRWFIGAFHYFDPQTVPESEEATR